MCQARRTGWLVRADVAKFEELGKSGSCLCLGLSRNIWADSIDAETIFLLAVKDYWEMLTDKEFDLVDGG